MSQHDRAGLSRLDWIAAAEDRYGKSSAAWKFSCPICGFVASVADWQAAGAPEGAVAFSCVGRYRDEAKEAFSSKRAAGPCNYSGGGLFKLNPVLVVDEQDSEHWMFDFADRPVALDATRATTTAADESRDGRPTPNPQSETGSVER